MSKERITAAGARKRMIETHRAIRDVERETHLTELATGRAEALKLFDEIDRLIARKSDMDRLTSISVSIRKGFEDRAAGFSEGFIQATKNEYRARGFNVDWSEEYGLEISWAFSLYCSTCRGTGEAPKGVPCNDCDGYGKMEKPAGI